MSRQKLSFLFGAGFAAASLTACSWWMAGRRDFAPVDPIKMDHTYHYDSGADCSDCHGEVAAATDLRASFRPTEATCLECHERDNCSDCHTNVEARTPGTKTEPEPNELAFSHAAHAERVEEGCNSCHADAQTSTTAQVSVPSMDDCLGCHNHAEEYANASCLGCHPTLQDKPIVAVAEFDHSGDWMTRHGLLARSQGEHCQQCHVQTSCSECHAKTAPAAMVRLTPDVVGRTLMHRGDFATTHAIDSRANPEVCLRCHAVQNCNGCHEAVGLTPSGTDPRSPHPTGYALPGGTAFHGIDARQRAQSCAACHEDGPTSVCIDCHAVGGVGGNPHPPNWSQALEVPVANPMCRYCHTR